MKTSGLISKNNCILESLKDFFIEPEKSEEKTKIVLEIINGYLSKVNQKEILNIIEILLDLIPNMIWTKNTNNKFCIVYYKLFNKKHNDLHQKNKYEKKLCFLLEYYLINNNYGIIKEQAEMFVYIINKFAENNTLSKNLKKCRLENLCLRKIKYS